VLPPTGQLVWRQRRGPLDLLLERFEGAPLVRAETVVANSAQALGGEREWFAPGSFADLSHSEALNRPAFEQLPGGLRLGAATNESSSAVEHEVQVLEIRMDTPPVHRPAFNSPAWLLRAADERVGLGNGNRPAPLLTVSAEPWLVRGADGAVLAQTGSAAQAHQLVRAAGQRNRTAPGDGGPAAVAAGDLVSLNSL
jgi:hypothetical protein